MARTRIAKFNIQITASAEQLRHTFSQISDQSRGFAKTVGANLTQLSFAWNQISSAIQPLITHFNNLRQELDELAKTAARLQIAPEFLQTLELAGEHAGISFEIIERGLRDMQDRIGDIRRGTASGQLRDALSEIGLGSGNLSRDLNVAFEQIRQGLANIEDQATKASVAAEIFGRSGKEMLLIMSQNAGLEESAGILDRMNAAFTAEQLAQIESFNDAWGDLTRRFKALAQVMSIELAPQLQFLVDVLDKLIDFIQIINRSPIAGRALRSVLPGVELLGTGESDVAVTRLQQIRDEASKEARKQTRLLSSIDKKLDADVAIVESGVN